MPRSTSPSSPGVVLVAARYELVRELRIDGETVDWEAIDTALDRPVVVQLLRPELVHDPLAAERFSQFARVAARKTAVVGERVLDGGADRESGELFLVREWPASPAPTADVRPPKPREPGAIAQLLERLDSGPRWLVLSGLVVVLVVVGASIRPAVEGWLAWVNEPFLRTDRGLSLAPAVVAVPASGAQPGQSTATPAAPPPTVAATPLVARSVTATPLATGQPRRIVNTDGRGVALRTAPGGDRQPAKGYDEGVTVQAFEQSGEWTRIRGSDGREGWVLSVTLAP